MNKKLLLTLSKISYSIFRKHSLHSSNDGASCLPFFILGSGRNGSTVLSLILNRHTKMFVPSEQYALHHASMRFQLYNFLIWRDKIKLIVGEFADSKNNQGWRTDFNDLYQHLYHLPEHQRTLRRVIDEIIIHHSQQVSKKYEIWGDKSFFTTSYLEYIYPLYPASKYIFLIKDGRDVVSSYFKAGKEHFGSLSEIENAALHWKGSIDKWRLLNKKISSNQLLEIKYEDLVNHPYETTTSILSFLGFNFEEGMLDPSEVLDKGHLNASPHLGVLEPIHTNAIGKWRRNLTNEQVDIILPIIEDELKDYGYL